MNEVGEKCGGEREERVAREEAEEGTQSARGETRENGEESKRDVARERERDYETERERAREREVFYHPIKRGCECCVWRWTHPRVNALEPLRADDFSSRFRRGTSSSFSFSPR